MKNKIISFILYTASLICIILYFYIDFFSKINHTPMSRLIILILSCILMHLGARFLIKYNKKYNYILNKVNLIIWLILYLILLLNFTLFDSHFFRNGFMFVKWNKIILYDYFYNVINLIPFKIITEFIIGFIRGKISLSLFMDNIFGNFIAFMPFSFFLPKLFKKENNIKIFIITMIIIVSIIELTQFLTLSGTFDVDDYILNISGSYLMYRILRNKKIDKLINKIIKKE